MATSRAVDLAMGMALPDGRTLRQASTQDPWIVKEVLEPLLAWEPRPSALWYEASRGAAKTTLVSFAVLAQALLEDGLLVVWVARDKDQAQLMTDALTSMMRATPELASAIESTRRDEWKLSNGSALRVLSSDAGSAFGVGPGFRRFIAVCDELTMWREKALYDALASAAPKLAGSQVVVLCNAGVIGTWQHKLRQALAASPGTYIWAPPGHAPSSWLDVAALEVLKRTLSPGLFNRLHRNEWVLAAEDAVFKPEWLRLFDEPLTAEETKATILSADTAFEAKRTADYSVVAALQVGADAFRITDVFRQRVEFPELKRGLISMAGQHNPSAIVVEDAASGRSLRQELERGTRLPVIGRRPLGDKISRAYSVTALFEAGRVLFPRQAAWLPDVQSELLAFPSAPHDDIVDAIVQGLSYLVASGYASFDNPADQLRPSLAETSSRLGPGNRLAPVATGSGRTSSRAAGLHYGDYRARSRRGSGQSADASIRLADFL